MAVFIVVIGVILGFCLFSTALLRWNEVRYRKKGLPPGTMGWPVFGETTEFLKQGPSFMKNQRARSFFFWVYSLIFLWDLYLQDFSVFILSIFHSLVNSVLL